MISPRERTWRTAAAAGNGPILSVATAQALETTHAHGLYRVGAWLRTDTPGVTVCVRMVELSKDHQKVRESEVCTSPTREWQHFEVTRRTLARGNHLRFSLYQFSALPNDMFELDGFSVEKQIGGAWVELGTSLNGAPQRPTAPGGMRDYLTK